jgi:adenosylhomocysteine nucleosidase
MTELLILAALPEEADAIFPQMGDACHMSGLSIRSLRNVVVAVCGLGKVNAALAVGRLVTAQTRMIIMAGTCGRLQPHPGDTYWITEAVQHDFGAARPGGFHAYRGGSWPMGDSGDTKFRAIADPGLGLPHARIASGDLFVECPKRATVIATHTGAQLIDMEVAAVAQAAHLLGLPWAAIKAVTDDANGESRSDFMANLQIAARKAGEAVERLVGIQD